MLSKKQMWEYVDMLEKKVDELEKERYELSMDFYSFRNAIMESLHNLATGGNIDHILLRRCQVADDNKYLLRIHTLIDKIVNNKTKK